MANLEISSASLDSWDIETFSEGKLPQRNEDACGYSDSTLVLSDGATDKTGIDYAGRTGGEVLSELVVANALGTDLNGTDLVKAATDRVRSMYQQMNPEALLDSRYRASATMLVARLAVGKLCVTQVGDSSFRINGRQEYTNNKLVDTVNAELRRDYILRTGDIAGGREHIMERLRTQHIHQNNPNSEFGYGFIDGSPVPEKFIRYYEFNASDVDTIEIVSDGYYDLFPEEVSIEAYEARRRWLDQVDPDRYKIAPSTKSNDDRTVMIATLHKQSSIE